MLKKLMITTAASGLMLGAAFAQTQTSPNPSATQDQSQLSGGTTGAASGSANFISSQSSNQWLASELKGAEVLGPGDEKIGNVDDILFDKDGRVAAYVVGVGGFLGIGAKDVALAPTSFQVMQGKDSSDVKLKLSMTKDQLKQAQAFQSQRDQAAASRRATTGTNPGSGSGGLSGGMAPRPSQSTPGSTSR